MSKSPVTLEQLAKILSTSPSSSALLESLIDLEGEVNLRFGDTHLSSDTEFLSTYYSAYLFALLLENDIYEARMMMSRVPKSLLKVDTTIQNCLTLLRTVWHKKYAMVYEVLRLSPWPDTIRPLAQAHEAHFRNKTIDDLSLSYETIRLSSVASYLGLTTDSNAMEDSTDDNNSQLIKELTAKGWTYDSSSKLLKPEPAVDVRHRLSPEQIKIGQLAALIGNNGDD